MKRAFHIPIFSALLMTQLISVNPPAAAAQDWSSWKNWYGVTWRDIAANNLKYSKQMGYDYIGAHEWGPAGYGYTYYKNNPDAKGMKFYFIDPHTYRPVLDGYHRYISTATAYTQAEMDFNNKYMAWKSSDAFPDNMATGYPSGTAFSTVWDFQQQAVVDKVVESIIALAHQYEASSGDAGYPFTFAGSIFDTGALTGEFAAPGQGQVTLAYWTGADSSLIHGGITHEYSTYSDGRAAFFKQLRTRMSQEFPNAKWILQPSRIYHAAWLEELIRHIKDRADKAALTPDMISQEDAGAYFVDDANIYNSGINITKDMVGIAQVSQSAESQNRTDNAKAAVNGAWSNWFGNLGQTAGTPNFKAVTEVYPRLKLIRLIPNWDNLNGIPLANRSWDGSVYQSKTSSGSLQSYISSDVMYSRHWKTGKLFVVFNSTNGVIRLNPGETAASLQKTDGYFIEAGDAASDFTITASSTGAEIILKSSVFIPIDSTNGQVKGVGYILTISTAASGNSAPVITSAPSSTGTIGTALSYQITASNGPTSFNAAGLPTGLSVSTGTGLISGTPTTAATSIVALSASNAGGTGTKTLTLAVYSACDVNRDGSTNVADVQLQVNQALGATACTSDLNRDGKCNVIDVQRDVNAGLGGPCVVGP